MSLAVRKRVVDEREAASQSSGNDEDEVLQPERLGVVTCQGQDIYRSTARTSLSMSLDLIGYLSMRGVLSHLLCGFDPARHSSLAGRAIPLVN